MFITRAGELTPAAGLPAICASYGLTAAESRLLAEIVRGKSVVEAACGLCVGEATARTQMSRIFEKTGTARQTDLVALIAGFSMPLRA